MLEALHLWVQTDDKMIRPGNSIRTICCRFLYPTYLSETFSSDSIGYILWRGKGTIWKLKLVGQFSHPPAERKLSTFQNSNLHIVQSEMTLGSK